MSMSLRIVLLLGLAATACERTPADQHDARSAGWTARYDSPSEATDEPRVFDRGDHLEVRPGPNISLWHPDRTASGRFRLSVDITQTDSGLHHHGAGLTFGGSDVHGEDQRYTYFLVRGDGRFLIKMRNGRSTDPVVEWSEHAAVTRQDERGVSRNELAVEALADEVRFLVNGTEVHRSPRGDLPVDGLHGLRTVHDLHVKFGKPELRELE